MNKLILLILFLNIAIFPAQANLQVEICGENPFCSYFWFYFLSFLSSDRQIYWHAQASTILFYIDNEKINYLELPSITFQMSCLASALSPSILLGLYCPFHVWSIWNTKYSYCFNILLKQQEYYFENGRLCPSWTFQSLYLHQFNSALAKSLLDVWEKQNNESNLMTKINKASKLTPTILLESNSQGLHLLLCQN